jgi:hypothetical protein
LTIQPFDHLTNQPFNGLLAFQLCRFNDSTI